jgi:hypothetical protein
MDFGEKIREQPIVGIGFNTLSARTRIFRKELIKEFRVIENGAVSNQREIRDNAPKYNTKQIAAGIKCKEVGMQSF